MVPVPQLAIPMTFSAFIPRGFELFTSTVERIVEGLLKLLGSLGSLQISVRLGLGTRVGLEWYSSGTRVRLEWNSSGSRVGLEW